jgi:hypothetical protein
LEFLLHCISYRKEKQISLLKISKSTENIPSALLTQSGPQKTSHSGKERRGLPGASSECQIRFFYLTSFLPKTENKTFFGISMPTTGYSIHF